MIALEPTLPFALWLLPAKPAADQLERTILDLAQRHGTRAFLPHVTLCSGQAVNDASALNELATRWRPQQLKVEGLHWGEDAFTCCYLRLCPSPGADFIAEAQQAFANSHPPAVGLHLSLLYAIPAPDVPFAPSPGVAINRPALKEELQSQLPWLQTRHPDPNVDPNPITLSFDRLALVQPGRGGWRDGWPWKVIATEALVGR